MAEPIQGQDFEAVKARLDEIVQAVSDDELPLDDALDLYEEAVSLGLRVSDLLEEGIDPDEAGAAFAESSEPSPGAPADGAAQAAPIVASVPDADQAAPAE